MYKYTELQNKFHRIARVGNETIPEVNRSDMCQNRILIIVLITLLLHGEISVSIVDATAYRFLHDIVQYNIAGVPAIHEKTEWDFDPEVGKQRRIRYELENGRFGKYAIAKLGMVIGYKGSWGEPVKS